MHDTRAASTAISKWYINNVTQLIKHYVNSYSSNRSLTLSSIPNALNIVHVIVSSCAGGPHNIIISAGFLILTQWICKELVHRSIRCLLPFCRVVGVIWNINLRYLLCIVVLIIVVAVASTLFASPHTEGCKPCWIWIITTTDINKDGTDNESVLFRRLGRVKCLGGCPYSRRTNI